MKNKILNILLNLYYIFAFLSSLEIIYYISNKYGLSNCTYLIILTYIILCCIILNYKIQVDSKNNSDYNKKINCTAILINNINRFNYTNLKIIKDIKFDDILKIKIILKDGISSLLDYKYLYFLESKQNLIDFDKYIYDNYGKLEIETSSKLDKEDEKFYIKVKKENNLHYLCTSYNIKR